MGKNVSEAAGVLLHVAKRATAALIIFFYDRVADSADLSRDGKVNVLDIALVGQSFGSHARHSRRNPICNIGGNGSVDIIDMAMVAKNYGEAVQFLDVERSVIS